MGNRSARAVQDKPVVLVIGAGYGGIQVARALDKDAQYNVVLVDRKDYFLHNIASLRAAVQPEWIDRCLAPLTKVLKHGTVVQAEVEDITPDGIKVHGRDELISFQYLIVATGSAYAFPAKVALPTREGAAGVYSEMNRVVQNSTNVVIVGGGPTGCELAAEIRELYADKSITIVSASATLLPGGLSDEMKSRSLQGLTERHNIKVLLGERLAMADEIVQETKSTDLRYLEGQRKLQTDKGTEVECDLVFFCNGAKVNQASFGGLGDVRESDGRLRVNEFLQVEGYKHIFAVGDCMNFPETKMAAYTEFHAKVVSHNITAVARGSPLKVYQPPFAHPLMALPMGSRDGVMQLPLASHRVVGSTICTMAKSKDLFTSKFWSVVGLKPGEDAPALKEGDAATKQLNLASAFAVTPEEAEKLLAEGLDGPERPPGADHT